MQLLSLETHGVRALRDGVTWSVASGPMVVVTGPQGCGLSSFLAAIVWSACSLGVGEVAPAPPDVLRAGGKAATIRTRWALDDDEREAGGTSAPSLDAEVFYATGRLPRVDADPALLGAMSRYDHSPARSRVALVPARRVTDAAFPAFIDLELDQRRKRISEGPDRFAAVPSAVGRLFLERDLESFDRIRTTFARLTGGTRLVGATRSMEPEFALRSGMYVPLARLSHAERNAFVLAAVPVLLGLDRSVILLDTPELGLGPGRAAEWMEALVAATPRAQWIVATRDPAVLASVPAEHRIEIEPPQHGRRALEAS